MKQCVTVNTGLTRCSKCHLFTIMNMGFTTVNLPETPPACQFTGTINR